MKRQNRHRLYVAWSRSGLIKVGCTQNVEQRLVNLRRQFKLRGHDLFFMDASAPLRHGGMESVLIRWMSLEFKRFGGREWFIGTDVSRVMQMVADCTTAGLRD